VNIKGIVRGIESVRTANRDMNRKRIAVQPRRLTDAKCSTSRSDSMPSTSVLCATDGTAVLPDYRAGRRDDRRELLSVQLLVPGSAPYMAP